MLIGLVIFLLKLEIMKYSKISVEWLKPSKPTPSPPQKQNTRF